MARAAAVLLALVFGAAGIAKLRSPTDIRRALGGLGLPRPDLFAVALPVVELATALLLLLDPLTGGASAVALLAAFTTLLVGRLRTGHTGGCGCFGAWSTKPLSWRDVVRNLALIAVGCVAVLG
ncbi:MAG TPA: MauE/DoxX family redox-associated membrane protein [Acidimicrobiales bacterium]|nr:DoxX family membrane protein [Actinomycetes bacterium]MDP6106475.1 MauE/DoxX family redox-associated membrane protein [Acidimicrobiales bacterium]MCP4844172.1 DoxX family membrane protein [Actinomycetes bacterium]MDP6240566.1 MauE/DoxX family redox-associated membrane protein [Acidimicrobiales bacterium]MDP7124587.1 MauE/DoxX family redox-associated membrane protein [Acidimicrobiales bacterium]